VILTLSTSTTFGCEAQSALVTLQSVALRLYDFCRLCFNAYSEATGCSLGGYIEELQGPIPRIHQFPQIFHSEILGT
jgi:hypothetical protein